MQKFRNFLGILLILFIDLSCKKSPELATDYMPVFNKPVKVEVMKTKLTFSATFSGLNIEFAENCSFEWGKKTDGIFNTIDLGKISDYTFLVQIPTKLTQNITYQVRAWIKVGSKKFYSQPSYFVANAIPKPEIISLNRTYALWGDTIRVNGRNLAPEMTADGIKVIIESNAIQPVYTDSIQIVFLMPFSSTHGKLNISILINNILITDSLKIENAIPEVTSVSPEWVHFDDPISIKGKFRSEYSKRIVPVESDWSTSYRYNLVSLTDNEIVIKLSSQLACNFQNYISLKIISAQGTDDKFNRIFTGYSTKRVEHWKRLNNEASYSFTKGAILNGETYVIEKGVGWPPTPFWKYNTQTDQWSALAPCPVIIPKDGCMEACNGNIYAGFLRTTNQNSNFYVYSTLSNTWKECADLPFDANTKVRVSATIDNKIYVFMSGSNKKAIYDPINDNWSFSSCNVPAFINSTRMFIYNGEYYFYKASAGNIIYKYDLSNDSFSPISFSGLGYGGVFFTLNNRLFWISGCKVYEIDMLDKKLVEKPEFANTISDAYGDDSFLFELNKKAYFILAQDYMVSFSIDEK